jgi:hypothetical protein
MAALGYRTFDEMVGQTQRLKVAEEHMHYKSKGLDLRPLLRPSATINPQAIAITHTEHQDHEIDATVDRELISEAKAALEHGTPVVLRKRATNLQRTLGTMLSYEVSKRHGAAGLPEGTIRVQLTGHGGQSLGFCLAPGVDLDLAGDSNDGVGKCLSGGTVAVYPSQEVARRRRARATPSLDLSLSLDLFLSRPLVFLANHVFLFLARGLFI